MVLTNFMFIIYAICTIPVSGPHGASGGRGNLLWRPQKPPLAAAKTSSVRPRTVLPVSIFLQLCYSDICRHGMQT